MTAADLVIIGAGPAGMAAARTAADAGLSVLLLDEQPRPGGQIYRDVERVAPVRGALLGEDYTAGLPLARGLDGDRITRVPGATVWSIENGTRVAWTAEGRVRQAAGRRLLLATGALERPMPLPGWTLHGVMTAGAGQILLKQSGIVSGNAVLVGAGPLLYLVAAQMARAGSPPRALVETQTPRDLSAAFRHGSGALRGWRLMLKGIGLLAELRRAGVPRHRAARSIAIEGTGRAEAVCFQSGGRRHRVTCDTVYLHHGVVPNTQASRAIGVEHRWNAGQHAFEPVTDADGRTSLRTVFAAGDGAGIGGAKAAELAGRVAALAIARDLGAIDDTALAAATRPLRHALARERAPRAFIDAAYPPFAEALLPADDTIICRCEEVTAGAIRGFARLGCLGPNQAKAFGRVGMGPCQGRSCGLTVSAILARENGRTPEETGYFRIRPPLKPVTLGELAALTAADENEIDRRR
ncbi:FAD/NAD(P)-binding oxidoreductase [Zhengella mangrovi]|uniref:FAD/NAD(P)-binding oxidoreductase n=1 Tax=Zhengella mangrovi TaxID=1982044 RepID=A0A2G1QM96_9HYPH|nr:FAD/NAD(P)-binding oxidoreductase [Zhengella mangrovi]PHP66348.1 FAD/NAD(P)-binding oxidoreductase [Zhengella mangrovi]